MEIERLRKEINELLENVVDHSKRYSENRPIPSLEISFVLSKINKMQEHMAVLKHLLEEQELANKTGFKKHRLIQKIEKEEDNDFEEKQIPKEKVVEIAPGQQESVEKEIEATIENEGNEIVENTEKKEVQKSISNIEQLPIAKLFDALTLNDRYLYANELFDKDMTAFNDLVKSIDSCSSFEDAKNIIAQFEEKWNEENEHVIYFYNLVERRFM